MNEETGAPGDLDGELRSLGENLRGLFHSAWKSEDRLRFQRDIEAGVNELANSLRSAAKEFGESETGRQLKEDVEDLGERLRSGQVESTVRRDLTEVLRKVNEELGRAAKDWSSRPPPEPGDKP